MASLPRPSRPSLNVPPTGPLPSIPVGKTRPSPGASPSAASAGASPAGTSPGAGSPNPSSSLPKPPSRSPSSSSIPTTLMTNGATSPATSNTPSQPLPALPAGKQLRKTASYNVFPKSTTTPTPSSRPPSTHSTASTATTPRTSKRASSLYNTPARSQSLNVGSRAVTMNGPSPVPRSVPATPSLGTDSTVHEKAGEGDDTRGRPQSGTPKEKGNVVISLRVRPEGQHSEQSAAAVAAAGEWMVDGRQSLISYRGREGGEYYYDNVFTAHDKNAKVYDSGAKRLVRRVMEGYHGTVFAYGMTGTGKTYSMQGTATSPGVIPLAITDIFSFIRETPQREFLLRVSYLEIYNEKIHDLLSAPAQATGPGPPQETEIKLREDSKRGTYATPLKEEIVQSPTQLLRVIARGDHARRTSSTQFNARSSRSHAVVQIVVESRERHTGTAAVSDSKRAGIVPGGVRVSTLSLIDLAGSERAAESKERRTEGAHINKSLLTLGTVISKLSGSKDKSGQPTDKEGKHLPYRDSKLTRLLQPALSGNSLISILCTIQLGSANSAAASGQHTVETLNTLKFAARARNNIVSHAKKAEESHANIGDAGSRALLDRYRIEIIELRKQLEGQKQESEKAKDEEEEKQRQAEDEARHEEQMLEMQLARTALKERIGHLNRLILSSKSMGVNNRSFSALGMTQQRGSTFSNASLSKSVRSSGGSAFGSPHNMSRKSSLGSMKTDTTIKDAAQQGTTHTPNGSPPPEEEDEDTVGELGDGTATLATQVKNLQGDLVDKNRYIATLEKRLLQARRNSRSRASATFGNGPSSTIPEEETKESFDAVIRDKDAEIADLRARLDDKERMVAALKSAARKRDAADSRPPSASPNAVAGERGSPRTSVVSMDTVANGITKRTSNGSERSNGHASVGRSGSLNTPPSSLSKVTSVSDADRSESPSTPEAKMMQLAGGSPPRQVKRNHGVDEMTRMLDEMIRQKVESGGSINKPLPRRPNSQQIPSNSPIAQAIATNSEQRAASASEVVRPEEVEKKINGPRAVSPPASRPADINTTGTPKSPTSGTRPKASPSVDAGRLSGWESDIQRRRSLKKENREKAEAANATTNHVISPTGPPFSATSWMSQLSPAYSNGVNSPSTTIQSSPTMPARTSVEAERPGTSEKIPPLPNQLEGNQPRPSRDMLRVDHLTAPERDVSPGSDGTAILDEVQESSKRNSTVGLGIEAR